MLDGIMSLGDLDKLSDEDLRRIFRLSTEILQKRRDVEKGVTHETVADTDLIDDNGSRDYTR